MEVFVARQPIFTNKEEVFAYELLYRANHVNHFPDINGDEATADVIINSFLNIGIDELSSGKPCFINFTEKLLKLKLPTYFRPREIVVEILETVQPSPDLLEICKELKEMGYQIALDDFVFNKDNPYSYRLLQYADIIKVDFRQTTEQMRSKIEVLGLRSNIKMLAEKIETRGEYELAKKRGYDYFQGYFFSEPLIVSTHDVPAYFHSYFDIIAQLSHTEPSINEITQLIEQDLSLSYKLLKLINSPAYRPRNKINSIRQAIVLLGLLEIQKWIYVLALRETPTSKNQISKEIISICLTRAKMCEFIALHRNEKTLTSAYFLTGMFSLMDTLLSMTMDNVLSELPLEEGICEALKGKRNHFKDALDLSIAAEKGDWKRIIELCERLKLGVNDVFRCYSDAVIWSNKLMKPVTNKV
jgi:c-di-GMP-related signal transduction protein